VCGVYASHVLWFLGRADEAVRRCDEAVALARKLGHANTLALALDFAAALYYLRREPGPALRYADEAIAYCEEQQLPFWLAMATIFRGWALFADGVAEGPSLMLDGMTRYQELGAGLGGRLCAAMLGEVHLAAGTAEIGLAVFGGALAMLSRSEDRFFEAEVTRVRGELLRAVTPSDPAPAEACFREALAIAGHQQARALSLRAAVSLARLLAAQGRTDEATTVLEEAYDRLTEGVATPDVRNAAAMLDDLRARRAPVRTAVPA
jgi:predicted ATPase